MKNTIINQIFKSFGVMIIVICLYMTIEPVVSFGSSSTVSQSVTSELSIITPANNIGLSPNIDVSVGGQASGQTQIVVATNDHLGYSMTIQASSSLGMIGNSSSTQYIPAYVTSVAGIPDYNFTVPANTAYFGYTVEASTTSDLSSSFKDSLGVCGNSLGGDTQDKCWISATTTPYTIINRSTQTLLSGSTTTLKFLVYINSNPSPGIVNDTYVATTTLTAIAN